MEDLDINKDNLIDKEPTELDIIDVGMDERRVMAAQKIALGFKISDIATELRVSEAWVRSVKKEPGVKQLVMALQREAIEQAKFSLTTSTTKAAKRLNELISSDNQGIALAASNSVLDRLGLTAKTGISQSSGPVVNVHIGSMGRDELRAEIKQRAVILGLEE